MKHSELKNTLLLAGVLVSAGAQADDRFSINGYGFQDYRQTNANISSGASQRGTWDNNFFALVMSGKITDRDTVWAQLQTAGVPIQTESATTTRFTWVFVDHRFNDDLSAHVGRVHPADQFGQFVNHAL